LAAAVAFQAGRERFVAAILQALPIFIPNDVIRLITDYLVLVPTPADLHNWILCHRANRQLCSDDDPDM